MNILTIIQANMFIIISISFECISFYTQNYRCHFISIPPAQSNINSTNQLMDVNQKVHRFILFEVHGHQIRQLKSARLSMPLIFYLGRVVITISKNIWFIKLSVIIQTVYFIAEIVNKCCHALSLSLSLWD